MLPSETYARGLVRREIEQIDKSYRRANSAYDEAIDKLLARTANLNRKMKSRDFDTFARQVATMSDEPAMVTAGGALPRAIAGQQQSVQAAWSVNNDIVRYDACTQQELYGEPTLSAKRVLALSNGRRFQAINWTAPSNVAHHLLRRYVERERGEGVTASDLAGLTDVAARYAGVYLRMATLNRFADMPLQCIAPYGDGLLVGHLMRAGNPPRPRLVVRDKHGVRTLYGYAPEAALVVVAWRTFLTRADLSATRTRTLEATLPALQRAHDALAPDPRIAYTLAFPDLIPAEAHRKARAALTPFMRTWRDAGAAGFDHVSPDSGQTNSRPRTEDDEDWIETLNQTALANARKALWPREITDAYDA